MKTHTLRDEQIRDVARVTPAEVRDAVRVAGQLVDSLGDSAELVVSAANLTTLHRALVTMHSAMRAYSATLLPVGAERRTAR